jgi:hypothetical protein
VPFSGFAPGYRESCPQICDSVGFIFALQAAAILRSLQTARIETAFNAKHLADGAASYRTGPLPE